MKLLRHSSRFVKVVGHVCVYRQPLSRTLANIDRALFSTVQILSKTARIWRPSHPGQNALFQLPNMSADLSTSILTHSPIILQCRQSKESVIYAVPDWGRISPIPDHSNVPGNRHLPIGPGFGCTYVLISASF